MALEYFKRCPVDPTTTHDYASTGKRVSGFNARQWDRAPPAVV